MLRSLKELYGTGQGALRDVKDFYFDDRNWTIRYIVADTGTWLTGRQVLLTPRAIQLLGAAKKILRVNLTRKQMEDSPSIELRKPVSRQYEEDYYQYYGWPQYWMGDGLWGMTGVPIVGSPPEVHADKSTSTERAEPHLRSTQAVTGY